MSLKFIDDPRVIIYDRNRVITQATETNPSTLFTSNWNFFAAFWPHSNFGNFSLKVWKRWRKIKKSIYERDVTCRHPKCLWQMYSKQMQTVGATSLASYRSSYYLIPHSYTTCFSSNGSFFDWRHLSSSAMRCLLHTLSLSVSPLSCSLPRNLCLV